MGKLLGTRGEGVPGKTLEMWCTKYEWAARAKEHDAQVAGEVSRKAIEAQAEETWDAAKALMKTVKRSVTRLDARMAMVEVDDARAVKAMAEAIATLAKLAGELAAGRAWRCGGPGSAR